MWKQLSNFGSRGIVMSWHWMNETWRLQIPLKVYNFESFWVLIELNILYPQILVYSQTYCRKRIAWEGLKMNVKFYFCLLRSDVSDSYPYATKKDWKKILFFRGKSLNEMEQKVSEIMVLNFRFIFRVVNSPVTQQSPLCCLFIISTVQPLYCCHNQNKPEHKWKFSNDLSEEFFASIDKHFFISKPFCPEPPVSFSHW